MQLGGGEATAGPGGNLDPLFAETVRHKGAELLTSKVTEQTRTKQFPTANFSHTAQCFVAGLMVVGIVDPLDVLQIQRDETGTRRL